MSSPVQWSREGAIAVVRINNPPVNAVGHRVRAGLLAAFNAVERDPDIKLVLLYCTGRTFIAGADIREFGKPPQAPTLPDVTLSLENFTKPSLAVLHGSVLGGGLEVALACHYRILEVNAKVGLPEVKLGLLPGAGGTQRLPRLAGVAKALEMIVGGEPISAVEAKRHAIVDELYEGEPLAAGLAYAVQLLAQGVKPRRSGHIKVPADVSSTAELLMAKRDEVQRSQPGLYSPIRCITAIEAAIALPLSDGLQRERALFLECLASPQRAALIHAFFAERQAAKVVDLDASVIPRKLASTAVVGGGPLGVGIALALVGSGLPVKLLECNGERLEAALHRADALLQAGVQDGRLSEPLKREQLALISGVLDYADLAEVDLVIEAVCDDLDIKRQVFATMGRVCKTEAILASTASSLDLDQMANLSGRPGQVLGLHFFNPAHVTRLLGVVRASQTSAQVLTSALQLARQLSKTAVVVGVGDGFVGDRMALRYLREAEELVEEGFSVAQVDAALLEFGMEIAPVAMLDSSGLKFDALVREPSLAVRIETDPQHLWQRPIYALINEGARILEAGLARSASDIDVIFLKGYGFPAHRGGPMYLADQIGLAAVLHRIREFHQHHGERWQPAPLLERLVAEGKTFAELDQQG